MSLLEGADEKSIVTTEVEVLTTSAITVSWELVSYNWTITSLVPKLCVTVYEVADPSPIDVAYNLPVISVVKATVPVASGKVTVLSADNDPANNVSSFASATLPSNITPLDVLTVSTLFVVVVPVTCRSPETTKSLLTVKLLPTVTLLGIQFVKIHLYLT